MEGSQGKGNSKVQCICSNNNNNNNNNNDNNNNNNNNNNCCQKQLFNYVLICRK